MSKFVVAAMVLMAVGISLLLCFQAAKPENQIQHNAGIAPDELGNVLGINYWKVNFVMPPGTNFANFELQKRDDADNVQTVNKMGIRTTASTVSFVFAIVPIGGDLGTVDKVRMVLTGQNGTVSETGDNPLKGQNLIFTNQEERCQDGALILLRYSTRTLRGYSSTQPDRPWPDLLALKITPQSAIPSASSQPEQP